MQEVRMAFRYFIKLAYNGLAYSGWQIQPNAVTVQQWIENGLSAIAGVKCGVTGCGRTDAGVHAYIFYAHFDHDATLSKEALYHLTFRLNRYLPPDVVVHEIMTVLPGAHARYSALSREYEYLIIRKKDPFNFQRAYFVHGDLDLERMNDCAALLMGKHNFQCFSKVNTQVNNYFCDIQSAYWIEQDLILKFNIKADRFLRNMVRAIVGTMLDVGRGRLTTEEFKQIINSRSRSEAGFSVPAKGLSLKGVEYPAEIFTDRPINFSPESCEKIISHYYTDPKFHQCSGNEPNE